MVFLNLVHQFDRFHFSDWKMPFSQSECIRDLQWIKGQIPPIVVKICHPQGMLRFLSSPVKAAVTVEPGFAVCQSLIVPLR